MATLRYFINSKKRNLAPIYVRLSAGRDQVFIENTGISVNPDNWSNKTQTIKQRIQTDTDKEIIAKLYGRHSKSPKETDILGINEHLITELNNFHGQFTKEWLTASIDRYHNRRGPDEKTLNGYIDLFIKEAESGKRKNANNMRFAPGTIKSWKVFQRNFGEYQGIYTPKRLKWYKKNDKKIRPRKTVDFHHITIDFYNDFVNFLTDQGYMKGTRGGHIKKLKYFMEAAMNEEIPLHHNTEYRRKAFKTLTNPDAFSIYLNEEEIQKIYQLDLSQEPDLNTARDAFVTLCETALRVSDYRKVDINIRKAADGTKLIHINQTKTGGAVVIPVSDRLEAILNKYNGELPQMREQYINKYIKTVAQRAGITERITYEVEKKGMRHDTTAEKWELVTCHTGRRSACTNMYLAGIPTIDIMKISGHKTEKIFMNYIKITQEQNALKLSRHPYFNKLKIV